MGKNHLESVWEHVKDGAESAWDRVSSGLRRSVEDEENEIAQGWRGWGTDARRLARDAPRGWPSAGSHREAGGWSLGLDALVAAGFGAGLMYLLDPQRGRRRRALARDQAVSALTKLDDAIGVLSRDLANRTRGVLAEAQSLPGQLIGESTPDDVLIARVRSKLGRVVSTPRAIEVDASGGRVSLSGQVLASEAEGLLRAIASVPGVARVDDHLEVHATANDAPALQGGRERGERMAAPRENWSPTARLLVGAAGGLMLIGGAERGGPSGWVIGGFGAGLLARAATNIPIRDWAGTSGRESADRGQNEPRERSSPPEQASEETPVPASAEN